MALPSSIDTSERLRDSIGKVTSRHHLAHPKHKTNHTLHSHDAGTPLPVRVDGQVHLLMADSTIVSRSIPISMLYTTASKVNYIRTWSVQCTHLMTGTIGIATTCD